jgi:glycosyltransferase involved in cell wall biosynthesis
MTAKKILYLVAEDYYFCSHRLNLAKAAHKKGFDVYLATRTKDHQILIEKENIKVIPLKHFSRSGMNIIKEFLALKELYQIYQQEKPDIVHHVAMKPVLYGTCVAHILKVPRLINALGGLGYLEISKDFKAKIIKKIITFCFRKLLNRKNCTLIIQNPDDLKALTNAKAVKKEKITLIKGSGVDTKAFPATKEPTISNKGPVIAFVSRMLWDKGVKELIEAAKILKEKDIAFQLVFCGDIDPSNPSSLKKEQLIQWDKEGLILWKGPTQDIANVYAKSHIAVLPSYREGLPKSLLEAASCGRPIVTTDVPGCREVVKEGVNGFLVPVKESVPLAQALEKLIKNKKQREAFGKASRERVLKEFSQEKIVSQILSLYKV